MKIAYRRVMKLALLAVFGASAAPALINPSFTPIHVVQQSELILEVQIAPGDASGRHVATIMNVLKGKFESRTLTIETSSAAQEQAKEFQRFILAAGKEPALVFIGDSLADALSATSRSVRTAYLHVDAQWCDLVIGKNGAWDFAKINSPMQSTWAGGTDMFRRAVRYILEDPSPHLPSQAEVTWGNVANIGNVTGKIRAMKPVDVAGDGSLMLFVASDQGDRLLACRNNSGEFTDVGVARKLTSKSAAFAWGDFNGDGRLDLVSFDGKTLNLYLQEADGTFKAQPLDLSPALGNGCAYLAALDCGREGRAGFVIATKSWPVLVSFDAAGKAETHVLDGKDVNPDALGAAGPCLVADFDNDGIPDIVCAFEKGSLFLKGEAPGKFAPAVSCAIRLGAPPFSACTADMDGDGKLDVFCVADDGSRLWQNEGGGKFAETIGISGEIAYISKPCGIACMAGDVNNDGLQDLLIAYDNVGAQLFFNRGFRSTGHAHQLDLTEKRLLPEAEQGQQAGCLGDFNGDGAQDMILALPNGDLYAFYRENDAQDALTITVTLPSKSKCPGPVTVTGWIGQRCLGAWNVEAGGNPAFFGVRDPGIVTVRWRLPGKGVQKKQVTIEGKPVRVVIE